MSALRAVSVGLGWWSGELAKAVHGRSHKIEIAGCVSRSSEKVEGFKAQFSCTGYDAYEDVLADRHVDAVILTTPHSMHADHVVAAARAGKHVFCEKPLALSWQEACRAVEACADAGVVLAVGHNRRFSAAAQSLLGLVEAGKLGRIVHFEACFAAPSARRWTAQSWRASHKESPGGGLAGLAIHTIDLLIALGGRIERVTAQAKRLVLDLPVDDTTSALFDTERDATASLVTLTASPYRHHLNIYGSEANAFAEVDADRLSIQPLGGTAEAIPLEPVDTLHAELEAFADACRGTAGFPVDLDEVMHGIAVLEAIVASASRGGAPVRPIDIAAAEPA